METLRTSRRRVKSWFHRPARRRVRSWFHRPGTARRRVRPEIHRPGTARRRVRPWFHRHWRGTAAVTAAFVGLSMLTLAPAGAAVGVNGLAQQQARQSTAELPQIGAEVRDGPVTFVVHLLRCGADPDGTRHGQLCAVTIGARNDGLEDVTVPGTRVALVGSKGAHHLPAGDDPEPFGTLAPGEAATAKLRYDLPLGWRAHQVLVHADPYSPGQAVAIGGPPLPLD